MKKAILILGAAFVLAGCNQEQGSSSDTYSTGTTNNASSSRSSSRNAPTAPSSTETNKTQTPRSTEP
jgi:predicted small secreted protein